MPLMTDILEHNREFVARKDYVPFLTDRFPDKRLIIVTCMDTRLVELLPRAMNLRQGDMKIVKSAGAVVTHPFGGIMRSILVAVYELNAAEVFVVGHHDCGMLGLSCDRILQKARDRGVPEAVLATLQHSGIDLPRWLSGFASVEEGVRKSVDLIGNHPLLPRDVAVHGLIIHPETGKLDVVIDGYGGRA